MRTYDDVRRIIDQALGDGIGMSAAKAYARLPAVARAVWFVEMLGANADGSMHLHSQQFSTGTLDGPSLLARLAEAVRPMEPVAAEFCRWVAERGAAFRRTGGDESFVSIVNLVGVHVLPHLATLLHHVAERWPDDLELEALPDPAVGPRVTREPSASTPHFPDVAVDLTGTVDHVISSVVFALWRANASDAALESCARELRAAKRELPSAIAAWIPFDGDGAAMTERLFPRHPLDVLLGRALEPWSGIVRFDAARFDEVAVALEPAGFLVCRASAERSAARAIVTASRCDPDGVVVDAADLATADDVEALIRITWVGAVAVVCGDNAELDARLASPDGNFAPVHDRRSGS